MVSVLHLSDGRNQLIFAVQDEIAQAATKALQPKLLGSSGAANSRGTNPQAYQAYLKANS